MSREVYFSQWLQKERMGQYVAQQEQAFFDKACKDIFGQFALQLSLSEFPCMRESRILEKILIGSGALANLQAPAEALPLDWRSVDLVAMPHGLEFSEYPHQVLNEVCRVLVPDGRLLLTGFNPFSLWGLKKQLNHQALPCRSQMINMSRLKDWLKLLGFEVLSGCFMVYVPPCKCDQTLHRWRFLEAAGDRWWPHFAAVYAIDAIKRVYTMKPLTYCRYKPAIVTSPIGRPVPAEQHTYIPAAGCADADRHI